jgi:hypothetical protein
VTADAIWIISQTSIRRLFGRKVITDLEGTGEGPDEGNDFSDSTGP